MRKLKSSVAVETTSSPTFTWTPDTTKKSSQCSRRRVAFSRTPFISFILKTGFFSINCFLWVELWKRLEWKGFMIFFGFFLSTDSVDWSQYESHKGFQFVRFATSIDFTKETKGTNSELNQQSRRKDNLYGLTYFKATLVWPTHWFFHIRLRDCLYP